MSELSDSVGRLPFRRYPCGCAMPDKPRAWPTNAVGLWWLCATHALMVEVDVGPAAKEGDSE